MNITWFERLIESHTFHFIDDSVSEKDMDSFFGPLLGIENIIKIKPEWNTLAHLVTEIGVFNSVGQAKKNGWNKPIKDGFTDIFKIGKFKNRICILKNII